MANLRELHEANLNLSLENPNLFGLPADITYDDGTKQSVTGQLLGHRVEVNPDTGVPVIVGNPVLVVRRSSLNQIPEDGQNIHVRMPLDPSRTATKYDFFLDPSRSIEDGRSLGIMRLYLKFAENQTP